MNFNSSISFFLIAILCANAIQSQSHVATDLKSKHVKSEQWLTVPEPVASLVRPILDLQQHSLTECGRVGAPSKCIEGDTYNREQQRKQELAQLLHDLRKKNNAASDEALVVLMCFYVGESQEETDAVISRGRRMLEYLNKYQYARPTASHRAYSDSMLKDRAIKADEFAGAIRAIAKNNK